MPIVPPGSVYSPGDDIARALMQIGAGLPGIIDPRRGTRQRAMELLSDPDKVKPIAQRIYGEALEIDPATGEPRINEERYNQAIRDVAVSMGLRPDNEREFNVVRPVVDAAVSALPAETKVQLELSQQDSFREKLRDQAEAQTEAATQTAKAEAAKGEFTTEYMNESLSLGIPSQQAQWESDTLSVQQEQVDLQKEWMPVFRAMGADDEVLQTIHATGGPEAVARYLMEKDLQAKRLAARISAGGAVDVSPNELRQIIATEEKLLLEAEAAVDAAEETGDEDKINRAISNYIRVRDRVRTLAGYAGLPTSYYSAEPQLVPGNSGIPFVPFDSEAPRVEWRGGATTVPQNAGISQEGHENNMRGLRAMFNQHPRQAEQTLIDAWNNPGSDLGYRLRQYPLEHLEAMIHDIAVNTGVPVERFLSMVRGQKSRPARGSAEERTQIEERARRSGGAKGFAEGEF